MKQVFLRITFGFIFLVMTNSREAMAIEEPVFTVIEKKADYEVRRYQSILYAETEIDSDFAEAGNKAFRILADYIFGNNKPRTEIAMTVPVQQASRSVKIAMTAPVTQEEKNGKYLVRFTMPSQYTMETIPEPVDKRITLKQVPNKEFAVYSYTGSWSQSNYNQHLARFRESLQRDQRELIGEPIFARFNSPWMIWFLRRNEIWIEVKPNL